MWTDTVSFYALHDVGVPDVIMKMWGHLRAGVLYFMRYLQNQHSEEGIKEAQDELFSYEALVQETFGMHELMTHNLHTCVSHVPDQARECGATAFAGEWWLERLMQTFKRVTKYRSSRYPETTAVNHFLKQAALGRIAQEDPTVTSLIDEIRAPRTTASDVGVNTPPPLKDATDDASWLSGSLVDVTRDLSVVRYALLAM